MEQGRSAGKGTTHPNEVNSIQLHIPAPKQSIAQQPMHQSLSPPAQHLALGDDLADGSTASGYSPRRGSRIDLSASHVWIVREMKTRKCKSPTNLMRELVLSTVRWWAIMIMWYGILFAYCALTGALVRAAMKEEKYSDVYLEMLEWGIAEPQARRLLANLQLRYNDPYEKWDWWGSTWFMMCSISTVGYGTHVPTTSAAIVLTVLFTVVGIPLFVVAMNHFQEAQSVLIKKAEQVRIAYRMGIIHDSTMSTTGITIDPRNVNDIDENGYVDFVELKIGLKKISGVDPSWGQVYDCLMKCGITRGLATHNQAKKVATEWLAQCEDMYPPYVLYMAILHYLFIVFFGGIIMHNLELEWDLLGGLWWAHITVTTIGLGDYAPLTKRGQIFAFIYIPFAISIMAFLAKVGYMNIVRGLNEFRSADELVDSIAKTKEVLPGSVAVSSWVKSSVNSGQEHDVEEQKARKISGWRLLFNFLVVRPIETTVVCLIGASIISVMQDGNHEKWLELHAQILPTYGHKIQNFLRREGYNKDPVERVLEFEKAVQACRKAPNSLDERREEIDCTEYNQPQSYQYLLTQTKYVLGDEGNWGLGKAFSFTFTTLTTIGYGDLTLWDNGGKLFTILYSVFGIAVLGTIFGANVMAVIEYMDVRFTSFGYFNKIALKYVKRDLKKAYETLGLDGVAYGDINMVRKVLRCVNHGATPDKNLVYLAWLAATHDFDSEEQIPINAIKAGIEATLKRSAEKEATESRNLLICFLALAVWISFMTIWMHLSEDMSYGECFYFMWISVSTIGYGDIVPMKGVSLPILILFLYVGLPLTTIVVGTIAIKCQPPINSFLRRALPILHEREEPS